jgi:hypothetical protein
MIGVSAHLKIDNEKKNQISASLENALSGKNNFF